MPGKPRVRADATTVVLVTPAVRAAQHDGPDGTMFPAFVAGQQVCDSHLGFPRYVGRDIWCQSMKDHPGPHRGWHAHQQTWIEWTT